MTTTHTTINVGDEFKLFHERRFLLTDGGYFEAIEDNGGFIMPIYLTFMEESEKALLREEMIHVRMIKEGNKILFMTRYGNSPLIFEANFDPTLYGDKRAMQIAFHNHMVTFIGVERSDNRIQTIRQANFPMKLKQALITAWSSAYDESDYSSNYTEWIDGLYRYSTFELWEMGENVGYFGERGLLE